MSMAKACNALQSALRCDGSTADRAGASPINEPRSRGRRTSGSSKAMTLGIIDGPTASTMRCRHSSNVASGRVNSWLTIWESSWPIVLRGGRWPTASNFEPKRLKSAWCSRTAASINADLPLPDGPRIETIIRSPRAVRANASRSLSSASSRPYNLSGISNRDSRSAAPTAINGVECPALDRSANSSGCVRSRARAACRYRSSCMSEHALA